MSIIDTQFQQQLEQNGAIEHHLVLALSGGMDSRVLLHLLGKGQKQGQFSSVRAVHVHHGLSPNADRWAQQCIDWCNEAGIACVVEHVHLDLTGGESIEQLAREARYQALRKHLNPNDYLLTGQHADDQLETFVLAMKRGSGPKGLSGMSAKRVFGQGWLIRPLLACTREQIEAYAHDHQLSWVEDESNQDTRYDRNYLRHQVIPHLTQRWPHIYQAVQRSAELCAQQEKLIDSLVSPLFDACHQPDGSLSVEPLVQYDSLVRVQLIRKWFAYHGYKMPSKAHVMMIWEQVAMSNQDANPQLALKNVHVRRHNHKLYLLAEMMDVSDWSACLKIGENLVLPDRLGQLSLVPSGNGEIQLPPGADSVRVVFEPSGLSAHPKERGHSRKLKKLFQEYGVPSWQRRRLPILLYEEQVVAIAGLFVSKSFSGRDCELVWDK